MKELTWTSVLIGIAVGFVMTAANVYLALYAGMTVSASIPAAVVALGIYRGLLKQESIHQSNIVQTIASAGESLAGGIVFTLPALVLVGAWQGFEFWPTTLIAVVGGLLGIIFMIPLRRALITENKTLVYPEGVACGAVLKAGGDTKDSSGFFNILKGVALGGFFKFLSTGLGVFQGSVELAKKMGSSVFFAGADISPALLSVGYIVRLEIASLVMIGGFIGWVVSIPFLGTPDAHSALSSIDLAWTLWSTEVRYLGVGAMIVGGIWSIFSVRKGILSGLVQLKSTLTQKEQQSEKAEDRDISFKTMLLVFGASSLGILFLYNNLIGSFGLSLMTALIMIVISFFLVAVSAYIVGLVGTSNSPVSGMSISALLIAAGLFFLLGMQGNSAILATLGVAAVVCCAICTSGDVCQDLKTGHIIGASPRSQQLAQICGVVFPAIVIAPVLTLLHKAYGIGTGLKAPQATLFAFLTKSFFGEGNLPVRMIVLGMILGVVMITVDQLFLKEKKFRLHVMPTAVGIYLPITLAVPIVIGGFLRFLAEKKLASKYNEAKDPGLLLSSGLIAGEALMGVVIAVFLYFNMDLKLGLFSKGVSDVLSLLGLGGICYYLYRSAFKVK